MSWLNNVTPESMGLPSAAVEGMLDDLQSLCMHSFMVMRRNQVLAEGYWKPFSAQRKHRMYSVSKTFVSASIGHLVDKGLLSLDDKVVKFFPDKLPENPSPYLMDMTIRDLLMMATPHTRPTYARDRKDWVDSFFITEPDHPAGTVWAYDTSGSFILDVIVERVTGKTFLESMREDILDPIGFSKDAWCINSPDGYSWGGSGVECTTRDLARFATVFANHGQWEGRQLLSRQYVDEATSNLIDNNYTGHEDDTDGSFGYGYQVWQIRNGAYAFLGMGAQLALILPKEELVFVCTGDTQGNPNGYRQIFNALWDNIVVHLHDAALPEDAAAQKKLADRLAGLGVAPQKGSAASPWVEKISGKTFTMTANPMGITKMRLDFEGDTLTWSYTNPRGDKQIKLGLGHIEEGVFPEEHYFGPTIGTPAGRGYRCLSSAGWTRENQLVLRIWLTDDYYGNLAVNLGFKGDEVGVLMCKTAEWFLDEYQGFAGGKMA